MRRSQFKERFASISEDRRTYLNEHLSLCEAGSDIARAYAKEVRECRAGRPCRMPACPLCWDEAAKNSIRCNHDLFRDVPKENVFQITVLFEPRLSLFRPRDTAVEFNHWREIQRRKLRKTRNRFALLAGRFELDVKRRTETAYLQSSILLVPTSDDGTDEAAESPDGDTQEYSHEVLVPHFHGLIAVWEKGKWSSKKRIRSWFISDGEHKDRVWVKKLQHNQDKDEAISQLSGYTHKGFTDGFKGDFLEQYVRFYTEVRRHRLQFQIGVRGGRKNSTSATQPSVTSRLRDHQQTIHHSVPYRVMHQQGGGIARV